MCLTLGVSLFASFEETIRLNRPGLAFVLFPPCIPRGPGVKAGLRRGCAGAAVLQCACLERAYMATCAGKKEGGIAEGERRGQNDEENVGYAVRPWSRGHALWRQQALHTAANSKKKKKKAANSNWLLGPRSVPRRRAAGIVQLCRYGGGWHAWRGELFRRDN